MTASQLFTGHGRVKLPNWLAFAVVALLVLAVWQQVELHDLKQQVQQGVYASDDSGNFARLDGAIQGLTQQIQGLQDCVAGAP